MSGTVLALLALLALTGRAQAETILWDNYGSGTISSANVDGSGGGPLNLGIPTFENPEGMAYDTVANRLYVVSSAGIRYVNLDGSGGGVFAAPGAPVDGPQGVTLDPVKRIIYWINGNSSTVSFAPLDGGSGGLLNTTGASLINGFRLALDPVGGRLYWADDKPGEAVISWANVNNSGGGVLNIAGATPPEFVTGVAVDPAGSRVYWVDSTGSRISYASLAGAGGGDLLLAGAPFNGPYGLAFDPTAGKFYWGNEENDTEKLNAIGFGLLTGGAGGITPIVAPVSNPQDPIILKAPSGAGAPAIARNAKSHAALSCSSGAWGADFPGSFVYQAPRTFAYQWTRDGKAIAGATGATLTAKSAGKYACTVTATNQGGAASQTSAAALVKAAKAKLTVKKKVTVKAGGTAAFKLTVANQGDLLSKAAKVCATVPKSARAALVAPKCKALGKLKTTGKRKATLKIKTKPGAAAGTYKVTFKVKGSAGKPAKARIQVLGTD